MAIGSGIAAQIGIANETTVNTPVPVTVFTEFDSETLEGRPNFTQGVGLRAGGLVPRSARRSLVTADAGGDVVFDIPSNGLGKWLQAMLGSYSTTASQISTTGAYQQIHNLGSADGKTFTLQKGAPSIDGTVNPLTYGGCKVTAWEIDAKPNDNVSIKATIDAMSVQPTGAGALALQTASYTAGSFLFTFLNITVSTFTAYTVVSGVWTPTSPVLIPNVRNIVVKGGQPKDVQRWVAGSATKAEALVNNFQMPTGALDIDFLNMTWFNDMMASTQVGIILSIQGAIVGTSGTNKATLNVVMPACFFEQGSTPKVGGPGIITPSYPFTALDDGTNGALQAYVISTDATV